MSATLRAQVIEIIGDDLSMTELPIAISAIKRPPSIPPGTLRKQLRKVAHATAKAHAEIKRLPRRQLLAVLSETLLEDLAHAQQVSEKLAAQLRVARSGGASTAKKQRAAEEAFNLLLCEPDSIGRDATLTRDGDYLRLAALLYQLATGRRADLTRACTKYRSIVASRLEDDHPDLSQRWKASRRRTAKR